MKFDLKLSFKILFFFKFTLTVSFTGVTLQHLILKDLMAFVSH